MFVSYFCILFPDYQNLVHPAQTRLIINQAQSRLLYRQFDSRPPLVHLYDMLRILFVSEYRIDRPY